MGVKERRQNRPGWRKTRGVVRVLVRLKGGRPKFDKYGRMVFNEKIGKTKEWQRC